MKKLDTSGLFREGAVNGCAGMTNDEVAQVLKGFAAGRSGDTSSE